MYYIQLQQVDYDDYPVGRPVNIGPFHTADEAEKFLENSNKFTKQYLTPNFFVWKYQANSSINLNYTVDIKPVSTMFTNPEYYT